MIETPSPETIREARKAAGLTQRRLAELIGSHRVNVTKWESGTQPPSREHSEALYRVLGIPERERFVWFHWRNWWRSGRVLYVRELTADVAFETQRNPEARLRKMHPTRGWSVPYLASSWAREELRRHGLPENVQAAAEAALRGEVSLPRATFVEQALANAIDVRAGASAVRRGENPAPPPVLFKPFRMPKGRQRRRRGGSR